MSEVAFIINPQARRGRARKYLAELRRFVAERLPEAHVLITEAPGHAALLAREAAARGYSRIFSVGGDGTLNEVVNGLMALPKAARPAVGILPTGTGRDFFRRLSELYPYPKDFSWLLHPLERSIDVGLAHLGHADRVMLRYYMNIADVGISGEVVRRVSTSKRRLGALEYPRSTLLAAWSYRSPRVKVRIFEGKELRLERDISLLLAVAANSRYFGGGMCIAPEAELDDGLFSFVVAEQLGYFSLLKHLPDVYLKRRIRHPQIEYATGTRMEVLAQKGDLPIGIDGEFLQAPRVAFEILPGELRLLVPGPPK